MQLLVLLVAAGMLAMGVGALAKPSLIPAQFGSDCPTGESRSEIRAVYGGFGVASAIALGWASQSDTATARGILITFAIALGGMAVGRFIGIAIERNASLYPTITFLIIEIAAAGALMFTANARA
jgi:Domain of unknown function (DUF4345)